MGWGKIALLRKKKKIAMVGLEPGTQGSMTPSPSDCATQTSDDNPHLFPIYNTHWDK